MDNKQQKYARCGYRVMLTFTREFTTGCHAGATHEDAMPFCWEGDATSWVEDINAANANGKLSYKVVRFEVIALEGGAS